MTSTHLSGVWLPRLDVGQCQCPSLSHITRANSQGVEEVSASHRQPLCGAGRSERVIQITIQHGPGLMRRSCAVFIVIEMELLTCSLVHRNINLSLISDKQHVITDLRSPAKCHGSAPTHCCCCPLMLFCVAVVVATAQQWAGAG